MKNKYIYHAFGLLAFLSALVTYLLTVQPSVPFWDCAEFSAASVWQQVPHPPGAPLFLMIGKLFHVLIPFGYEGWRVNLVSVFASAFTIWLLYLITVKVILNFKTNPLDKLADELAVYGSALVGALAFTFSDTFWFNAVESEVYAMSTVFVAVIVYLMMKWNEEADKPGHERYLLLIAYLIGLSTGVHLLAILTVFSIVLLVYFRKYQFSVSSFIWMGIIAIIIFLIIYPGIVKWIPAMLNGTLLFKNDCKEYLVENSAFVKVLAYGILIFSGFLLWYSHKKNWDLMKLISASFLLMMLGYSTYTQILIRSNSNSPMNENEPKNLSSLTSYLGREQYGDTPMWPRRYQNDDYYSSRYIKKETNGEFYYGEWYPPEREDVRCKDESRGISLPKFTKTNVAGEFTYMWRYQIYHMFIRYFLWNFMGRTSDIQDAPAWSIFDSQKEADQINYKMGYKSLYPIKFFAIPFLFGVFGLIFHFWKDPKMAFIFLIMFLLMGILATLQQNQQEPQPRERDYFYTGAFFVWCLWIGKGAYFLIDWISKGTFKNGPVAAIIIVSLLAVPVNMAVGGWKLHDRSGNYIPFDYSYNILQSCEKDAIVFTNGDNDTFPVWFIQDVEGVRRDVRIVNLSLGNTLWYIHQLKNREPWGAKKIPLSFTNESLLLPETDERALTYDLSKAQDITIPVPYDVMKKYTNDPLVLQDLNMKFTLVGKPYGQKDGVQYYLMRVQDKLILDILQQNKWQRPVYFSTTVGNDAFSGLESFFRNEGMVMRICPVKQRSSSGDAIDETIMKKCLMNVDNSDNFHKEPHFGFKLRNLNNMNVFYDEVHRRLMNNYRSLYVNYAAYFIQEGKDKKLAGPILDTMNKYISTDQFPLPYELEYRIARIYIEAGYKETADKWADMTIKSCMEVIENPELSPDSKYYGMYNPYRVAASMYEIKKDYPAARQLLQQFLGSLRQTYESIKGNDSYKDEIQKIYYSMYDVQVNIDEYEIEELELKGKTTEAIAKGDSILKQYQTSQDPNLQYFGKYIQGKIDEIKKKHNIPIEQALVETPAANN